MKPLMKYHLEIETRDGQKLKTWGIYPVFNTTKILDGIYDPENKQLKLLFDPIHEQYVDYPVEMKNGKWDVQQRKMMQHYRGTILEQDLEYFLNTYVDNNFEFTPPSKLILDTNVNV
jgi:hypothetical protein